MLTKIEKVIGGSVRVTGKGKEIIWVVNNKKTIQEIIKIFDLYPPLTSKKICQLKFLRICLQENSVDFYLLNRNFKYKDQLNIINSNNFFDFEKNSLLLPTYFNSWLSGFIEAEGCFSIRKNNYHSFSIAQKDEEELINSIKIYFDIQSKVRNSKGNI